MTALVRTPPPIALSKLLARAAARTRVSTAYVGVLTRRLELIGDCTALPPEIELSRAMAREGSFTDWATQRALASAISDVSQAELSPALLLRCRALNVRALVAAPIALEGERCGALVLIAHRPRDFEPALLTWLSAIAAEISEVLAEWIAQASKPELGGVDESCAQVQALAAQIELSLVELAPLVELARAARVEQRGYHASSLRQALVNLGEAEEAYEAARHDLQRLMKAAGLLEEAEEAPPLSEEREIS